MFRTILVPTDFSTSSILAAEHACRMARAIGGGVTFLHVTPGGHGSEAALQARLQAFAGNARLARPPLLEAAAGRDVASVILDVAAERRADLIVLGTGRVGTVARAVLARADVPVQVVPRQFQLHRQPDHRWRQLLCD
ncbi:hypothetical protein DKM44_14650 [Deinococcus irradiatisoli]|uniref:UspA domain-containing protein n=1 Tax=Deinococcus irradiatisoli TaxID=2202254 RepID=A0A2Z3JH33_9DEIO|nr:universal stress protein [Deinococcus irradiatisoli]AWN24315.1 hypothetical protein DKM44_14650 [Deinococcus irradiatisoli]